MARAKNTPYSSDAKYKLIQAFWDLLEDNEVHEISIGMLVAQAGVNRGTFYYHYEDKERFLSEVLELELSNVSNIVFMLITGVDTDVTDKIISDKHIARTALFMEHGGRNLIERKIKDYIVDIWTTLLCPSGGQIKDETRLVIEYMGSGMLGLLSYIGFQDEDKLMAFPTDFVKKYSQIAFGIICEAEGISQEDLLMRFRMYNQISKSSIGLIKQYDPQY